MKIIQKDNFDRDTQSENVIAENVSEYFAKLICELLNERISGPNANSFYKAEPDTYKPYEYEP